MIRSGSWRSATDRASRPLEADTTRNPLWARYVSTRETRRASSSTTRIVFAAVILWSFLKGFSYEYIKPHKEIDAIRKGNPIGWANGIARYLQLATHRRSSVSK